MIEKYSTGVEGLDQLTGGGFLRGSAYIIQGPPGAGKTLLANQFCYAHVRSGGRAIYMSLLAESTSRMLDYVSQMGFFDASVLPDSLQYISGYGVLEREGLSGLLELVQSELSRHRATAMVLDGTFVAQSLASEQEFRAFIHALQGVACINQAVLILLSHQNREVGAPEHTMVDGWIELLDEVRGIRSYRILQVRKYRGAANMAGRHRYRITKEGVVVYPQVERLWGTDAALRPDAPAPAERVSIGHAGIDRLLNGGLPAGSATLVVGPTGSGKTTLGLHFLSGSSAREPGLMLGFYEPPKRLVQKARDLGMPLDRLVEAGHLHFEWRHPGDTIADEVVSHLIREAKARRAKRILVEGISVVRDSLLNPERLPYIVNALTMELTAAGASVLYTIEVPELGLEKSLLPEHELSAMVHNVLFLNVGRRSGALHRRLSIIKVRDSDFDPRGHDIHITANGIALGQDPRITELGAAV